MNQDTFQSVLQPGDVWIYSRTEKCRTRPVPLPEAHVVVVDAFPHLVVHNDYCDIVAVESKKSGKNFFMQPLGLHDPQDPEDHHEIKGHFEVIVEDAHTFSVAVGSCDGISGSIYTMVNPSVVARSQLARGECASDCFL